MASANKLDPKTIVQWLWLDIGHTQLAQQILELGDIPVLNLSDKRYYTYFNIRYLGTKPFKYLRLPDGQPTSMNSISYMSEIIRWAKAGRSGAGASDAVGISDIGAYFNSVILPIMMLQNGIEKDILNQFKDGNTNCIIVAPMADAHNIPGIQHYLVDTPGARIQPTLYMAVLNLLPALSRNWLNRPELLISERSILLDMLPGIERAQMYGPAADRYNIKDCLTTAEFNLGNALSCHYSANATNTTITTNASNITRQRDKIAVPITNILPNGSMEVVKGYIYFSDIFREMMDYIPNFIIVWTSHNCHDVAYRRYSHNALTSIVSRKSESSITSTSNSYNTSYNSCNDYSNDLTKDTKSRDADYELKNRGDKNECNRTMLQSNAILARMMYKKMQTRGELKRGEIIRSPLFSILEKNRDKNKRDIYRKHCGSSSYHYITKTERYRTTLISSPQKSKAADTIMLEQLSDQLASAQL